MCNFIKADGVKCKIQSKSELCHIHKAHMDARGGYYPPYVIEKFNEKETVDALDLSPIEKNPSMDLHPPMNNNNDYHYTCDYDLESDLSASKPIQRSNIVVNLVKKVKLQADDITILNRRISVAMRKLYIISLIDKVKYTLAPYCINRSFREAIQDPNLREEVEDLFEVPQEKALAMYDSLLNKRNMLVHPYTAKDWNTTKQQHTKKKHGYTIKNLCSSIKAHEILLTKKYADVRPHDLNI